jgi:hypothetical protein
LRSEIVEAGDETSQFNDQVALQFGVFAFANEFLLIGTVDQVVAKEWGVHDTLKNGVHETSVALVAKSWVH